MRADLRREAGSRRRACRGPSQEEAEPTIGSVWPYGRRKTRNRGTEWAYTSSVVTLRTRGGVSRWLHSRHGGLRRRCAVACEDCSESSVLLGPAKADRGVGARDTEIPNCAQAGRGPSRNSALTCQYHPYFSHVACLSSPRLWSLSYGISLKSSQCWLFPLRAC